MNISGRNKLKGTIVNIVSGTVTAEVEVDIGGGNKVASVITKRSLDNLQLKVGDEVTALIKATSVMIMKE